MNEFLLSVAVLFLVLALCAWVADAIETKLRAREQKPTRDNVVQFERARPEW